MAPLSNYISFLFFTTLLLPRQTLARDSQFFSKLTHFNNNNNNKETEVVPKKELPVTNMPQEQQPAFITETKNSYGLYGHDSETENNKYYNNDAYNTKYHNKDVFVNNQNELSDTKYTEEGYNSMENQNKNNYFNNNAANERYYHNNNNNNNYNNDVANNDMYHGEKQGMSDTRFLEGGKYFYDLNYEKFNPTLYDDSSRGVNNNNWYNNRGNNNAYQNHGNYNVYQNQQEFEDEQNEFEP